MLRLPRIPSRQAGERARARARRHDDAIAHGRGVSAARPAGKVLRRLPGPAHRSRARHGRSPRHVRPRLHGQVLRGQGLSGHVNCSENFNGAGDAYGLAPRMGWEALNFFYNTGFDANNVFVMDEPWSRRGDYVLLRAMSDLVCASSRAPTTSIQRTAGRSCRSTCGCRPRQHVLGRHRPPSHRRRRPGADARDDLPSAHERADEELRRVPRLLAAALLRQRGRDRRYWACREKVAIMDLSPLRKWEVLGPDAETLIQHAITRDARRL